MRAHLRDGSTVVLPKGGTVSRADLSGEGQRYPLLSDMPAHALRPLTVPMDSVIGVETFEGHVQKGQTVVATAATTVVGAAAAWGLFIAIFGSCPTIYADTGAHALPAAEGFSYAISPWFEQRDLDPISVPVDSRGVVRLELRNEALETHFLTHLSLAAVTHGANEVVAPDQRNAPVAVSALRPPLRAVDRDGRDVRALLVHADDSVYASTATRIANARAGDLEDWITVDTEELPPGDSVAVVLRLRNSLLNTVLLYDGIMGGPDALDWMSRGTTHVSKLLGLAAWYRRTMGLRATVGAVDDSESSLADTAARRGMARLGDVGPIAFRDVAIVLPRPTASATRVRVRVRFVVDNWRIDQLRVGGAVRRPDVTSVPVARVIVPTPVGGGPAMEDTAARRMLQATDSQYLETRPGQRLRLEFLAPGAVPRHGELRAGSARVPGDSLTQYLIAWSGWYREWLRSAWLSNPVRRQTPFVPGDSAVLDALQRWQAQRVEFERAFRTTRLPVR
ncbi:MAG: hypothetical protein MUE41_04265 [Gemmatimonadaceae bacterium]|nr:hypothetical protein [Gemmatimonadaceae bacterium]